MAKKNIFLTEDSLSGCSCSNSSLSDDFKKNMVQYLKYVGSKDAQQKPYTDNVIASIKNVEEFAKLGTGLFIHWGVYSVPAGHYEGVDSRGNMVNKNISYNCEWSMRDLGIPKDVYKDYELQFTGDKFDADALVKKVSDCGMKYIILTAKHHEGFSLYPTSYGLWDIRTSACRNTIIDELKSACEKYDIKLGFYYSQYWDWMGEGGFGLDYNKKWCDTDPYTEEQHLAYCDSAVNEIDEMIKKYDPFLLWYDPGTSYASKYVQKFVNGENNLYPQILTNDRLDYGRNYGDYGTGERTIYLRSLPHGESCFTLNDTWGYSVNNDNKYFSVEKVFKQFLLYTLSYGQNCVLNVGPMPDGTVPQKQLDMLTEIENFTNKYGKFYNFKGVNKVSRPKWGYMVELEDNKILCYIVTKNNANYSNIVIDCVNTTNLESVDILTPGGNPTYEISENKVSVHDLVLDEKTKVGVVRLNYSSTPFHLDANLLTANEMLPSRTFVMKSGLSFDFTNLIYTTKASGKNPHKTVILWDGISSEYNGILDFETSNVSDTITLTIKDIETSASTTLTYLNDASESSDSVLLVHGKKYELTLVFDSNETNTIKINGITFVEKQTIIHPNSVTLNDSTLEMQDGETYQLTATVLPTDTTDKSVTWSSSDETIATVNDGLVTAMKAGDVTITVHTVDGNLTDTCQIKVTSEEPEIHVTSVVLNKTIMSIGINEDEQLTATILPSDATYKAVTWSSSDETIATVNDGLVHGISEGSATITVTTEDGGKTASCEVSIIVIHASSVTLNETSINLTPGFTSQLTATVLPEESIDKSVTWSSSDETIATVNDGLVFAKKQGMVTITVTTVDGNYSASCEVNVGDETYDYIFERESLDGSADQGDDTGLLLFSDDNQNWTLFGYAHSSLNEGQTDNNATLLQIVVNASPWNGYRIDADNNSYPIATKAQSPLIPRLLAGTDNYINPITGERSGGKPNIDVTADKHPVCLSRNGNVYKYSLDGITWTELTNLTSTQLARLSNCKLTVGFDYKRSNGQITDTKYRLLRTDHPCCVSIKNESEYPFYTLYHKYDTTI